MKGTGTMSSPISIDTDDESETEVANVLTRSSGRSTPRQSSTDVVPHIDRADPIRRRTPAQVEQPQNFTNEDCFRPGRSSERGTKRQRSESMGSRGSNDEDPRPDVGGPSNGPQHESRKAKKRKRNAEKKKEQYMQRLARLEHAPNLVPQYPEGVVLADARASAFPFLPHLPQLLSSGDLHPPGGFFAQGQVHNLNMWGPGLTMQTGQMGQYDASMYPGWGFPQADPLSVMTATMNIESPPMPANLDAQSIPPNMKPPAQIGLTDEDPNSKHGLFKIPESTFDRDDTRYIPTIACTLVLENLPKTHKNREFVAGWARNACGGTDPARVIIDGSGGKAMVEFASSEDANTAWRSPQLGPELRGLKSHLLKGKPREDLIRAYWYRVDGISAGVGELEEGEIEVSGPKEPERPPRRTKRKQDQDRRVHRRWEAVPGPSVHQLPHPSATMAFNGLPQRPQLNTHFLPAPLATNGLPLPGIAPDGEDMDIESPDGSTPFNPPSTLNYNAQPFVPLPKVPSELQMTRPYPGETVERPGGKPGRSSTWPTPPTPAQIPSPAAPPATSSSAKEMEADLRARVLQTRRPAKLPNRTSSTSTPIILGSAVLLEPVTSAPSKEHRSSPPTPMDDAESFIAQAVGVIPPPARPPPPPRSTSAAQMRDLIAKQQRLAKDISERKLLMDRLDKATTKEVKDEILSLLREKDRASKEQTTDPADAAPMRPSAKLNLDFIPAPQPRRTVWPNHQQETVFLISDDEGDSEDEGPQDL